MSLALRRCLSTLPARPWFVVDPMPHEPPSVSSPSSLPPLDKSIPETHPLQTVREHLATLPLLERSSVQITRPLPMPSGPSLPSRLPQGRRQRGRSYVGEGLPLPGGGDVWEWVVLATVKEGTEGRGAVDAVLRSTRKLLLERHPDVRLPSFGFSRRSTRGSDGWGMLDAGDFAVHVLSREARQRWFGPPPADWR